MAFVAQRQSTYLQPVGSEDIWRGRFRWIDGQDTEESEDPLPVQFVCVSFPDAVNLHNVLQLLYLSTTNEIDGGG